MDVLEHLRDERGAAILGWLEARTLFARFEQTISADVASRFGRRLTSLIGDAGGVHYFVDSSAVIEYDLAAFPFVLDAMLAKREQFKLIVVLPWGGPVGKRAQTFADAFGCVEYVPTAAEFDARLIAAAPRTPIRAARLSSAAVQASEHSEQSRDPGETIAFPNARHWLSDERSFERRR